MTESRNLVLGTAGHIDHGKTALVRALTGVDTDRLPAEKQRGITIDLGFAFLDLPGHRLAMVDVPGHERFVRNMLAGASGMDLALLVVAADDSVMPQTREHLDILNLMRLSGGVIAITKSDLADPSWLDLVEDEIRKLVAGTFLEGAPIVRTSTATGAGIESLKLTLAEIAAGVPSVEDLGPFRMAIDRSFTRAGLGTIVTGTVASGEVRVGDDLQWMPDGRTVKVRGLHRHDQAVESVSRGARAAINLGGVHHNEVVRGQELGTIGYLQASRVLSVTLNLSPDAPRGLKHRGRYRLHVGTADVAATLSMFEANVLAAGETGLGQLLLAEPVVAVAGEPFILREESPPATLGGGRILQASTRRYRRRDGSVIERLSILSQGDETAKVRGVLSSYKLQAWSDLDLCREAALPLHSLAGILATMKARGELVDLPVGPRRTMRVTSEVVAELEDRVMRAMKRLHDAHPRQSVIRRSHLLATLPDLPGEAPISAILDRLIEQKLVVGERQTVALRAFEPKLSQAERKLKKEIHAAILSGGFSPPEVADLAKTAGARADVVPELLAILVDEGKLVRVSPALYLDSDVDAQLRDQVTGLLRESETMTMSDLRDLLKTSRKYAVPIGEYLDQIRLTHREGDLRRLANLGGEDISNHE